jgi:hypothetical protein
MRLKGAFGRIALPRSLVPQKLPDSIVSNCAIQNRLTEAGQIIEGACRTPRLPRERGRLSQMPLPGNATWILSQTLSKNNKGIDTASVNPTTEKSSARCRVAH